MYWEYLDILTESYTCRLLITENLFEIINLKIFLADIFEPKCPNNPKPEFILVRKNVKTLPSCTLL